MRTLILLSVLGAALALIPARTFPLELAPLRLRPRQEVVIDGTSTTIGVASAYYLRGLMPSSLSILQKILGILLPSSPEEDIDYFALIKEDVKRVVGDYIDQHNMHQLEIYKDDLGRLLQRYLEAPVESATYPDKNTVANSLSISIVANRFLVEAGERPQSMIIHYADIASIHILVLKDAAETYTGPDTVSRWWVDLNDQLDHYIDYGRRLQNSVVDWRNDMMTCTFEQSGKYDSWTVQDDVAGITDVCKQLQGTHNCDDHCQAYQIHMNREVTTFIWNYMGKALREWEDLKVQASEMAAHAH
ncbi:uncharacterized protein LOC119590083 [Penaeus monodon]|uniref:uncharacterized protein LOC119590083 n=1 Tax=Penaeus monodon TaxID=6687 RepID=UPI0018A79A37|nr:uncharacterized protein LOC119590083 [Penaeus monodon]XP_037794770.1 uncharacterized protein LOC119590083 [Penaeus monodon]XP_037794771.1 uncharacterized protein LOC119590083 [Penaeus monodon]